VDVTSDGEQAGAMAGEMDYDLLMLDLNFPRVDGITILRHLHTRKPSMPILVLTSRNRVEDGVQCLDLGADDYMGGPFSFAELSARISRAPPQKPCASGSLADGSGPKLDWVERRVERAGKRIELTSKEFGLLEYLMLNAGRRVTRAMIIDHVSNLSFDTGTNVIDVYVNYSGIVQTRTFQRLRFDFNWTLRSHLLGSTSSSAEKAVDNSSSSSGSNQDRRNNCYRRRSASRA
jgi:two-component system copper resistance phosphate regulon response regulator CusR